jgi:hypothetical protein
MSGLVGGGSMLQRLSVLNDFMIRFTFDFETADGAIGDVVPEGAIVYKTIVTVTSTWDSASPSVKVGTTNVWELSPDDDDEAFFAAGMVDLTTIGSYVNRTVYQMIDDGQILLDLNHDGASKGKAIITQLFIPGEYV